MQTAYTTAYNTSIDGGDTITKRNTYGFDGRVLTETNALDDTTVTNTYKLAGRLLTQTDGNRTGLESAGIDAYETAYTYDVNNRLQEETKETAGLTEIATYYYDANGNQMAKANSTLQSSTGAAAVTLSEVIADSELMSYNGFN